ncbi:hypothetical protein HHK36_013188 [Tetracentron sinense]|uniref:Uncharacterized protein n=1 Tax=Tetracentron sinense TaxID=13715 RepID=A0A834ZAA9_TETSI|nr:hypothetical protein HHK36_013188 [Tetracentron sinense]
MQEEPAGTIGETVEGRSQQKPWNLETTRSGKSFAEDMTDSNMKFSSDYPKTLSLIWLDGNPMRLSGDAQDIVMFHTILYLFSGRLPNQDVAGFRVRLNKILASDYFTTTPEMKALVEVAAAAGTFAPCQVPVDNSTVPFLEPVQEQDAFAHYQRKNSRGIDVDPRRNMGI